MGEVLAAPEEPDCRVIRYAELLAARGYRDDDALNLAELVVKLLARRERRAASRDRRRQARRWSTGFASPRKRQVLWGMSEGHCAMCGFWVPFEEMTVGHIVPASWGGTTAWSNVQLECEPCNTRKGARVIPRREGASPPGPWLDPGFPGRGRALPASGRVPALPGEPAVPTRGRAFPLPLAG